MSAKLILGYIVRDEERILKFTLPKLRPFVDGIVVIDAFSKDGTVPLLHSYNAKVEQRPWTCHYGDTRNACIALAERNFDEGTSTLLMLDADECMTARDLVTLRSVIDSDEMTGIGVIFPRYEFVDDFFHFNPAYYPDYQARCFPLHFGFRYEGKLHEQLIWRDEKMFAARSGRAVVVPYLHIFHYSKTKSPAETWLRYENYRRLTAGEPRLDAAPADAAIPTSYSNGPRLIFQGERPI